MSHFLDLLNMLGSKLWACLIDNWKYKLNLVKKRARKRKDKAKESSYKSKTGEGKSKKRDDFI